MQTTRAPRRTKMVNYCDSFDDDDDDFSSSAKAPPPRKKAREEVKQQKNKSSSSKSSGQEERDSQSRMSGQDRKPLVEKVFERDLEAALTLSLMHSGKEDPNVTGVQDCPTQEEENVPPPPTVQHISNCSVNLAVLGLDQISSCAPSRREPQGGGAKSKDEDEDYLPKMTPETDSDDSDDGDDGDDGDVSEAPDSEDEEFTVKKVNKTSKKDKKTKTEKKTKASPKHPGGPPRTPKPPGGPPRTPKPPASKKEKQPSKTSKSHHSAVISQPIRSPPLTASSPSSPGCHPLSPAGGSRVPKWNPPGHVMSSGHVGRSPGSSQTLPGRSPGQTVPGRSPGQTVPGRSPGQGLRLGLSRRVRVKPLHPSVTSN